MATENLLNLKVHKVSSTTYEDLEKNNKLDTTAIYLTPDDTEERLASLEETKADNYYDASATQAVPGDISSDELKDYTIETIQIHAGLTSIPNVCEHETIITFEHGDSIIWSHIGPGEYALYYYTSDSSSSTMLASYVQGTADEGYAYKWVTNYAEEGFKLPTPQKISTITEVYYYVVQEVIKSYTVSGFKINPEYNYKTKADKYIIQEHGTQVHPNYSIGGNAVVGKYSWNDIEIGTDISGWTITGGTVNSELNHDGDYYPFLDDIYSTAAILSTTKQDAVIKDPGVAGALIVNDSCWWSTGTWTDNSICSYTFPEGSIVTYIDKNLKFNDKVLFVDHLHKTIDCKYNYKESKPVYKTSDTKTNTIQQGASHYFYANPRDYGWSFYSKTDNKYPMVQSIDIYSIALKVSDPAGELASSGINNNDILYIYSTSIDRANISDINGTFVLSETARITDPTNELYPGRQIFITGAINISEDEDAISVIIENLTISDANLTSSSRVSYSFDYTQEFNNNIRINYTVPTITQQQTTHYKINFEQVVKKLLELDILSLDDFEEISTGDTQPVVHN